jgi:hypothetical protein
MTCYNSELPIGPPGPVGPQGPSGKLPYKVYTALLTQSGVTAPTAIELENTLGTDLEWDYNGPGAYLLTAPALFLANKTFILLGSSFDDAAAFNSFAQANRLNDDSINIFTGILISSAVGENVTIQPENNYLNNTPIEIRIYP